jgi:hypothetical protein
VAEVTKKKEAPKNETPEEKKERIMRERLEAGAEALGSGLSDVSSVLTAPGGRLPQPAGTLGKGNFSPGDPLMYTQGDRPLRGRGFKKGGSVKSRDGIAIKGKTKGRFV